MGLCPDEAGVNQLHLKASFTRALELGSMWQVFYARGSKMEIAVLKYSAKYWTSS